MSTRFYFSLIAVVTLCACMHDEMALPTGVSEIRTIVGLVAEKTPLGEEWDSIDDPPDVRVCISVDGKAEVCSPTVENSFEPKWSGETTTTVEFLGEEEERHTISIRMIDVDEQSEDLICQTARTEVEPLLRGTYCCDKRGIVFLEVNPKGHKNKYPEEGNLKNCFDNCCGL